MDSQVLAYVRQQRKSGFSDEQIAGALRAQKYPESLISTTLKTASQPIKATASLLRTYVQTYQQQGYSDDRIRAGLVEQGFIEEDIQKALFKPPKKKRHVGVLVVFPILTAVILFGGYVLITSDAFDEPDIPLLVSTERVRLGDIIGNLLPLANRNPTAALALCDNVVESDRQRCILTVGRESSDPALCEDITDERLRDTCFLDFIYDGHYEFCPRLTLPSNIQYCNAVNA